MDLEKLDYECTIRKTEKPLVTENTLLLIPGPVNISPRVTHALTNRTLPTYYSEELYDIMDNLQKMTRYVFQTNNKFTIIQQTSGNGATETMISNLTEPGDTVIAVVSGFWGDRMAMIAERYKLNVIRMESKLGQVFSLEEFEREIQKHKPAALFLCHGETASGHLQPLEGLGDVCHKYDCILCVDGVITVGAVPVFVDRWKLDALVTCGQKGVGALAGISMLSFSDLAQKRMMAKKTRPPFYLDAIGVGKFFNCFPGGRSYNYTYNSHMLCALHEALTEICEEGLINCWQRHKQCAEALWIGLEKLGLMIPVNKDLRLVPVTIVKTPDDVKYPALLERLHERYQILVGFGTGLTKGYLRIGFMGYNARPHVVEYFLEALSESMEYVRKYKQDGPSEIPVQAS